MQPGSSLGDLGGVPGTVPIGLAKGAATAQQDLTNPTNLVTKPIGEIGKLPLISGGLPSLPGLNTLNASSPNKFAPLLPGVTGKNSSNGSSGTGGASTVKNFTDKLNDAVKKVTGGLTGGLHKASTP